MEDQNNNPAWGLKGAGYLYLLAWQDMIERLDTLILEIRHFQVNIIYTLRAPWLYQPLRAEEQHLWGASWFGFERADATQRDIMSGIAESNCRAMAKNAITLYPRPSEGRLFDDIKNAPQLERDLHNAWLGGMWAREQKRHYHYLRALQKVKREILYDKLMICRYAIECGLHLPSTQNATDAEIDASNKKSRFLVQRAGAIKKLSVYVRMLLNLQDAFSKSMDVGLSDHPRPSMERRREFGIYMDFLSERTNNLLRDLRLLLWHKLDEKKSSANSETKLIFHRWRHRTSTKTEYMDEDVDDAASSCYSPRSSLRFVITTYFMPERPDLQPMIAHEVAHVVVRDQFNNFRPGGMTGGGDFARFVNKVKVIFNNYTGENKIFPTQARANALLTALSSDFLAASVKGLTYLYAQFLEIIGGGLEKLLTAQSGKILLDGVYELDAAPLAAFRERESYLRLRLTAYWLKRIHHWRIIKIDLCLVDGVIRVANDINAMLNRHLSGVEGEMARSWSLICDELESTIRNDRAPMLIKEWRSERSSDNYVHRPNEMEASKEKGRRFLPRSMKRLDNNVRKLLFCIQMEYKSKSEQEGRNNYNAEGNTNAQHNDHEIRIGDRPLSDFRVDPIKLVQAFHDYYGVNFIDHVHDSANIVGDEPIHLYRHLYDIPWQCALMRAMDILGVYIPENTRRVIGLSDAGSGLSPNRIVDALHHDFALGRDLFQIALDFNLWDTEPSTRRLAVAIRIVKDFIHKFSETKSGSDASTPRPESILTCISAWLRYGWPVIQDFSGSVLARTYDSDWARRQFTDRRIGRLGKDVADLYSNVVNISSNDAWTVHNDLHAWMVEMLVALTKLRTGAYEKNFHVGRRIDAKLSMFCLPPIAILEAANRPNLSQTNQGRAPRDLGEMNLQDTERMRRLTEKLAGHAIKSLLETIDNIRHTPSIKLPSVLNSLYIFLSTRAPEKVNHSRDAFGSDHPATSMSKAQFYHLLGNAIAPQAPGAETIEPVMHSPRLLSTYILGRLVFAGAYPIPKLFDKEHRMGESGENSDGANKATLPFCSVFDHGTVCINYSNGARVTGRAPVIMHSLLGRYDKVAWSRTKSLCRCICLGFLRHFRHRSIVMIPVPFNVLKIIHKIRALIIGRKGPLIAELIYSIPMRVGIRRQASSFVGKWQPQSSYVSLVSKSTSLTRKILA